MASSSAFLAEIWRWFYREKGPGFQPSGRARHFLEFLGAEGPLVNKTTQLGSQRCKPCHEGKKTQTNNNPLGKQNFRWGKNERMILEAEEKNGFIVPSCRNK